MGGDYASARDITATFYRLRAPEHPFGSRKGNAVEKGVDRGRWKKYAVAEGGR